MSSIRKRGEKWQARVHRKENKPIVKSFNNKSDALKWARNIESQLDLGTLAPKQTMPRLMPMVDRYVEEVTPLKKVNHKSATAPTSLERQSWPT